MSVIGIPINNEFEKIKSAVDQCDGVILSGGDAFTEEDFLIVDYLYKRDIPTLGICLGMQAMSELFNNREEIKVEGHYSKDKYVHEVKIKKNTLLYKILNQDKIMVNSRHKTAIPRTDLEVSAISDDNVIEAVEDKNKTFFLGVQWHPETISDNNSYQIFNCFIKSLK